LIWVGADEDERRHKGNANAKAVSRRNPRSLNVLFDPIRHRYRRPSVAK